ncbi:MAG: hypothetical protein MJ086_01585 [Lachnospiraceae bacterium]|nr:hypothetical protein [Lachnospiraceae bacterium]
MKKRLIATLLVAVLVLGMSITAFAKTYTDSTVNATKIEVGDILDLNSVETLANCDEFAFCVDCKQLYMAFSSSGIPRDLREMPEHEGHYCGWIYGEDLPWFVGPEGPGPDLYTVMQNDYLLIPYEEVPATCTEDGHKAYWKNARWDWYYADENGEQPINNIDAWLAGDGKNPMIDHNIVLENQKDPTCKEEGYTGDKVCSMCEEIFEEGESIPKLDKHNFKDGTCTICGEKDPNYKEPTNNPQTGDASNVALWIVIALAGASVITATSLYAKKSR